MCEAGGGIVSERRRQDRYVHFGVAARSRRIHGDDDSIGVVPHDRPLRITQHNNGNPSARKILLIGKVLIRGDQELKPGILGSF